MDIPSSFVLQATSQADESLFRERWKVIVSFGECMYNVPRVKMAL